MSEEDLQMILRFSESTLSAFKVYEPGNMMSSEKKEVLEHFAAVFTVLDPQSFRDVFNVHMELLYNHILEDQMILTVSDYLLINASSSCAFANIVLRFLVRKIPQLASLPTRKSNLECRVMLRLFKTVFRSLGLFPDNELMLQPYLRKIVKLALLSAIEVKKPSNFLFLLRFLFRSIAQGKFELLYKEFAPMIPDVLCALLRIHDKVDAAELREIVIELCLIIPARLSALLPHLKLLVRPVVLALGSHGPNVPLGLRTLEFWIDSLNPDFLYPILRKKPMLERLMTSLCDLLQFPRSHHDAFVLRLLGKLGGRNRRFLQEPSFISYRDVTKHTPRTLKMCIRLPTSVNTKWWSREEIIVLQDVSAMAKATMDFLNKHFDHTQATDPSELSTEDKKERKKTDETSQTKDVSKPEEQTNEVLDKHYKRAAHDTLSYVLKYMLQQFAVSDTPTADLCKLHLPGPLLPDLLLCIFKSACDDDMDTALKTQARGWVTQLTLLLHRHAETPIPSTVEELAASLGEDPDSNVQASAATTSRDGLELSNALLIKPLLACVADPNTTIAAFGLELLEHFFTTLNTIYSDRKALLRGAVGLMKTLKDELDANCHDKDWRVQLRTVQAIRLVMKRLPDDWTISHHRHLCHSLLFVLNSHLPEVAKHTVEPTKAAVMDVLRICVNDIPAHTAASTKQVPPETQLTATLHQTTGSGVQNTPHIAQSPSNSSTDAAVASPEMMASSVDPSTPSVFSVPPALRIGGVASSTTPSDANAMDVEENNSHDSSATAAPNVVPTPTERPLSSPCVQGLASMFIQELVSCREDVRECAKTALDEIARRQGVTVNDVMHLYLENFRKLIFRSLNTNPLEVQCGILDGQCYQLSLKPALFGDMDDVYRVLCEAVTMTEVFKPQSPPNAQNSRTRAAALRLFPLTPSAEVKLRVKVLQLMSVVVRHAPKAFRSAKSLNRWKPSPGQLFIRLFITSLGHTSPEIMDAALDSLGSVISTSHSNGDKHLTTELLQQCLRSVLHNVKDHKRLSLPLLHSLSRLLKMLSGFFNSSLGERLFQHLQCWTQPVKIMQLRLWKSGEEPLIAAAILDLFHVLPPCDNIGYLVSTTTRLESVLYQFPSYGYISSPYREPLVRFLCRYSDKAIEYFLDQSKLLNAQSASLFRAILKSPLGQQLRTALMTVKGSTLLRKATFAVTFPSSLDQKTGMQSKVRASSNMQRVVSLHTIGLEIVLALSERERGWLSCQKQIMDCLLMMWRPRARQEKLFSEEMSLQTQKETTLLVKCLIAYARERPGDVAVVYDLLITFMSPTLIDFSFLRLFYTDEVAKTFATHHKYNLIEYFLTLYSSTQVATTLKVAALRMLVIPILSTSFFQGDTNLLDSKLLRKIMATMLTEDLHNPCKTKGQEALRIELLKLATLLIR